MSLISPLYKTKRRQPVYIPRQPWGLEQEWLESRFGSLKRAWEALASFNGAEGMEVGR